MELRSAEVGWLVAMGPSARHPDLDDVRRRPGSRAEIRVAASVNVETFVLRPRR